MSSNGNPDISLGGSTKLSRLDNLGFAGVVCDGRLRDFDELAEFDAAVWCTGETVRGGGNLIQPYVSDQPVTVDGVTVIPDDIIFADGTGAVVIPADVAGATVELARKIKDGAGRMAEMIKDEDPREVIENGSKEA